MSDAHPPTSRDPASDDPAARPSLVEVRFLPTGAYAWVRGGMGLVDAGEAAGVEIVTGCTRGQCGTDPVRLRRVEPESAMSPVGDGERATLERMGLEPADGWRLACVATVGTGGLVEIEVDAF